MDFPYVKEALTKLFSKPSTIAFPAAPSPAKPNYRGRIVFHPEKCISCNMCERVCAGQAISHTSEPCEEGERITRQFYLGSCTFCSHCASFCTHGAIELSDDYHMIATKEEDLIVSGTYIKKAPVKKPAPAAPAAAPAAPKAAEEKPAEQPKEEEKPAKATRSRAKKETVSDVKAEAAAEVTEAPAAKPKRTRKPKAEAAEEVKEAAPAPEAPKAEEKAAPAEEAPAPTAPPEPRDDGKPVQDPSKCIYCTLCARNCPVGALTVDRKAKTWVLDEDLCVACGTCQGACPKDAIVM